MEVWKSVVSYPELFEVSNTGKLRNKRTKKELKQYLTKKGYLNIATRIGGRKGKAVCFKLHREVALAFIPNPLGLPQVNHIDAVKINNNESNLEWATAKENVIHATNLGLNVTPCQKDNRKLTDDEVLFIRANYKSRDRVYGSRALGRRFGVNKSVIFGIVHHKRYKDSQDD